MDLLRLSPSAQLRHQLCYVAHAALKSGSGSQAVALLRQLLTSSLGGDMRLIEAAMAGGSNADKPLGGRSALGALLTLLDADRGCAQVHSLLLRLVGRMLTLAADDSADHRAVRAKAAQWLSSVEWARRGWAWILEATKPMPADEELAETLSRLLFASDASDASPMHSAPRREVLDERLTHRISVEDDVVASFAHAPLLVPLIRLCATAPPELQHRLLTNLSLWLRHSDDDVNQRLLAAQSGWQVPVCEMLNHGSAARTASASYDLCLHLVATHLVAALRHLDAEAGWAEVQRTVTFVETHTVASTSAQTDLYLQVYMT